MSRIGHGFLLEHIDAGASWLSGPQRGFQRPGHDQASPAGVDQDRVRGGQDKKPR